MTAQDIINNAMRELDLGGGINEPISAEDSDLCLSKLNRIFDNWNAESQFVYGTNLSDFTLIPNHNPHTIGLAGSDFLVPIGRPSKITEANLILTDVTPNIHRPLNIVDDAWYMSNEAPDLATQIPYYLYPNYGWPKGQLYFWPVPATAYKVRLNIWIQFIALALSDTFSLPPGYEDAITLTLAESLISPFKADASPSLVQAAKTARDRIKSINGIAPVMACDPAVQSLDSRPRISIANFYSGFID